MVDPLPESAPPASWPAFPACRSRSARRATARGSGRRYCGGRLGLGLARDRQHVLRDGGGGAGRSCSVMAAAPFRGRGKSGKLSSEDRPYMAPAREREHVAGRRGQNNGPWAVDLPPTRPYQPDFRFKRIPNGDHADMANTPQSKKRARQNTARFDINKARRSRIRTFLRKVEEAIASGDKDAARDRPAYRSARADARREQRHPAPEHRLTENVPPVGPREGDRLIRTGSFRVA